MSSDPHCQWVPAVRAGAHGASVHRSPHCSSASPLQFLPCYTGPFLFTQRVQLLPASVPVLSSAYTSLPPCLTNFFLLSLQVPHHNSLLRPSPDQVTSPSFMLTPYPAFHLHSTYLCWDWVIICMIMGSILSLLLDSMLLKG